MAQVGSDQQKSFALQEETAVAASTVPGKEGLSRQPLELYHLSHDLRGPLNSILGFSELMLQGIEGPLTEHQEADLAAIYQSAQNLLWMIDAVVDLSKLEADQLKFELRPVDLRQVLEKVLAIDFGSSQPEQIELISRLPNSLPPLWGSSIRIEQMVLGLIRFAFKVQKRGQVTLAAESSGGEVTLQLRLEGVSLPPEKVAELFELVVRTDTTGRTELGAGGLELPLVQRLAAKHRGRVWVESEEGSGTHFYLSLPISAQ